MIQEARNVAEIKVAGLMHEIENLKEKHKAHTGVLEVAVTASVCVI